ncbi:hypothetical protein ACFU9B_41400 [Streptomyces sp. NPDC057592]|uniref:hypothetical protein n=1 Tax=unclassified Streptomyces TaxID=2593676 RepID=UPI0036B9CE64
MDNVIDLDDAAAEITARLSVWSASGLSPRPITWRDEAAPWPQQLETDRAVVADPESIGVRILGVDGWTELHLVLYRGGWADLDVLTDDEATSECPRITTPEEFGNLLNTAVTRFLGTGGLRR